MNEAPSELMDVLVDDSIDREEDVDFMYRDASKKGWVTCGVGKKLNSAIEATRLLLPDGTSAWRMGGRPATVAEVSIEFVRVNSMPIGHVATYYRSAQSPKLAPGFAVDLCRRELASDYLPGVLRLVPNAYELPRSVVRALITIEYTCGAGGLAAFHHMLASVARGDFKGIADRKEYHLAPPATDRTNDKLGGWFAEAAGASS